jgi:DNA-binding response OmpR family regulator
MDEVRMSSIALIDDDCQLVDVLKLELEDAGFHVLTAADGRAGLALIESQRPAAVVLDVNMPVCDGLSVCRKLRAAGDRTPIVLLTARDGELDEVLGLELGADDYVAKPFSTRVLLARIAALLRRERLGDSTGVGDEVFRLGKLAIDGARLELRWDGALVSTTLTELRLIEALARRAGRVLSRQRILEHARGDDSIVVERLVDTYVRRMRQKLGALDPGFDRIETVVGAGYRWRDD